MSETKAGNIEAIRDWSKRYFYTKSDVSEFFTKLNGGLTAYKLTIIGPVNADITITDNDQTNPQEYVIKTSSSGVYTGLFFFNAGNTLSLTGDGISETYTLNDYIDTITLTQLSSLIPQMTSYTEPSGNVSSSGEYNANYVAWHAFDGIDNTKWASPSGNAWLQYEFATSKLVKKMYISSGGEGGGGDTYELQAYYGESYVSLMSPRSFGPTVSEEVMVNPNNIESNIFRISYVGSSTHNTAEIQLYGV